MTQIYKIKMVRLSFPIELFESVQISVISVYLR
jgi:hypothetical protein